MAISAAARLAAPAVAAARSRGELFQISIAAHVKDLTLNFVGIGSSPSVADLVVLVVVAAVASAAEAGPASCGRSSSPSGPRVLLGPILHLMAFQASSAIVLMTSLLKEGYPVASRSPST